MTWGDSLSDRSATPNLLQWDILVNLNAISLNRHHCSTLNCFDTWPGAHAISVKGESWDVQISPTPTVKNRNVSIPHHIWKYWLHKENTMCLFGQHFSRRVFCYQGHSEGCSHGATPAGIFQHNPKAIHNILANWWWIRTISFVRFHMICLCPTDSYGLVVDLYAYFLYVTVQITFYEFISNHHILHSVFSV